ncbi:MAG: hypothetical protein OEY22_01175 [Candidatus Bathyarchaeota archaeon]|nr:hypothetical protein [Candidatus Bathyarchaeota archaeon]
MVKEEHEDSNHIDKLRRQYRYHQGGIFRDATRERIMTKKGISGRGRTKAQFWYRQREYVKTALIDLQLFLEMAGKNNVNQVVTAESLKPIVNALLWHPILDEDAPDQNRAEISELFIKAGFEYLNVKSSNHITLSHKRTIDEALNLTSYLVRHFKGE